MWVCLVSVHLTYDFPVASSKESRWTRPSEPPEEALPEAAGIKSHAAVQSKFALVFQSHNSG